MTQKMRTVRVTKEEKEEYWESGKLTTKKHGETGHTKKRKKHTTVPTPAP
jgi:hypothetical protein